MNIHWSDTAKESYAEELDFIFKKWGNKEVVNFMNLSDNFLKTLGSGIVEGKPSKKGKFRVSVISKQTSLVYKFDRKTKRIDLILFWNNLKNPKEFERLLNS